MALLDELHKAGSTICMVTHDPRYAEFADRKIFMFDGRVVDEETMHRLRHEEDAAPAASARAGAVVNRRLAPSPARALRAPPPARRTAQQGKR